MTHPDLVTSPEVAAEIHKSVRTVHRLRLAGELVPVMKVGTGTNAAFLFAREDVEALKARRFPSTAAAA